MSIQAPQGILNIPNATLRVGRLEISEVVGADTALNTIARNTILLVDDDTYHENKNWGLKLPNAWAGEFECNTASAGNYSEFNFYNEGASSNAQGYNLTFNDTAVQLRYDGSLLTSGSIASTVTGTGVKKVRLMFERNILSVTVDGTLVFTHDDTSGPRPRVYSTTAGGFLNFFTDGGALKNLKIVNEKWMSDGTSNIAYVGGGEVAVGKALAFNRVSNVSQIKVDSNVVTEYTGPHDRPLRKYPEVAMTSDSQGGYVVTPSTQNGVNVAAYNMFDGSARSGRWRPNATNDTYSQVSPFLYNGTRSSSISDTSGTTHDGVFLKLELPKAIKLDHTIIRENSDPASGTPGKITFLGSTNGTDWTFLKEFSGMSSTALDETYIINDTNYYNHFAFVVKNLSDASGELTLGEWELYGYEEGSGSLDTTLKTVYNVPATTGTQLEVYYDAKGESTVQSPIPDLSPNTNTGAVSGHLPTLDSIDGIESFKFNGSSQYISSTIDTSYWGTNKLHSVAFWFKADRIDGKYNIFHIGNPSNNESSGFWISDGSADSNGGNSLNWWFASAGGDSTTKVTTFSWTLNTWYHIALTFDGSTKKMYINGKHNDFSTNNTATPPTGIPNSASLAVGSTTNSVDYFDGSIANFRVYGAKTLNAGQVQELYDYQKDYFLGSKSQLTLYKGHLGVGVTEPSGQLELAGDERIQEYPPMAMTGWETYMEGHGVFRAGKSGHDAYLGSWDRWKVFNKGFTASGGTTGDAYHGEQSYSSSTGLYTGSESLGGISGDYFILDMPYKISLKHTNLTSANQNRSPTAFVILGSNDGSTWTQIKSFSSSFPNTGVTLSFQVNSTEYFSYFGLVVTKIVASDGYFMLSEWQLFGTPGPTTLDKGSLTLGRSLDVPHVSRYDVDTETPRPEKLVVDFDTTVNSTPTDISGKGNHGSFVGNAQYSPADKAFKFDGQGASYIYGSNPSGLPTGDAIYSLAGWVNIEPSITNVSSVIIYGSAWGQQTIATLSINTSYGLNAGIGGDYVKSTNAVITPKTWHHVACVKKATGVCNVNMFDLYVDGVLITDKTLVGGALTQTIASSPLYLSVGGGFTGVATDACNGLISNPKIYNVALEPSEVRKLYNLGRTGRSMVISDTAVGIGKAPEAQLDVRGTGRFQGLGVNTDNLIGALQVHQGPNISFGGTTATIRDVVPGFVISSDSAKWAMFINTNDDLMFTSHGSLSGTYTGVSGFILDGAYDQRMNDFTGQHRCFLRGIPREQIKDKVGLIVSSDKNKYTMISGDIITGQNAIDISESIPDVSISSKAYDKACFGVISDVEDPEKREDLYGVFGTPFPKEKGDDRIYINSLGEGAIWVMNTNGSLEAGDYITTSNVAGYGQKQDGAGLMNYTVAKITMDCDFNPATQPVQQILRSNVVETYYTAIVNDNEEEVDSDHPDAIEHTRVTDKIENVLDQHGQIQWEDDPSGATEKAYKIRYLDADGNITDEANHVYKAAFVGCTYHCG